MKKLKRSQENKFVSEGNTFQFIPKKDPVESGITEKEKILIELMNGRAPINDHERALLKDIEKIKEQKKIVDIPHDF